MRKQRAPLRRRSDELNNESVVVDLVVRALRFSQGSDVRRSIARLFTVAVVRRVDVIDVPQLPA